MRPATSSDDKPPYCSTLPITGMPILGKISVGVRNAARGPKIQIIGASSPKLFALPIEQPQRSGAYRQPWRNRPLRPPKRKEGLMAGNIAESRLRTGPGLSQAVAEIRRACEVPRDR